MGKLSINTLLVAIERVKRTALELVVVAGAVLLPVAHFELLDAGGVVGAQKVRRYTS